MRIAIPLSLDISYLKKSAKNLLPQEGWELTFFSVIVFLIMEV
jgi:hypothetical protein